MTTAEAAAQSSSSATGRVAALDLLRGIAAFTVAIAHFYVYGSHEDQIFEPLSVLAVEVFFVLSGFVLAPQILYCLQSGRLSTLLRFLSRRWMRTIPPYIVSLIAISVLLDKLDTSDFLLYLFYLQNLWRQTTTEDYFSIAWSLSVEEWFYVCFPILLLLLSRISGLRSTRLAIGATLLFIVTIVMLRTLLGNFDNWGADVRRVVIFRIDSIAFGFLLYTIMNKIALCGSRKTLAIAFALTAVVGLAITQQIQANDNLAAKHAFPFAAAAFGMVTLILFSALSPVIERHDTLRLISLHLGRISYSVYLFHLPVIFLLTDYISGQAEGVRLLVYAMTLTLLTTLFYYSFEKPILAARPRLE